MAALAVGTRRSMAVEPGARKLSPDVREVALPPPAALEVPPPLELPPPSRARSLRRREQGMAAASAKRWRNIHTPLNPVGYEEGLRSQQTYSCGATWYGATLGGPYPHQRACSHPAERTACLAWRAR
ncbi:hypothetical protein Vretimale_9896 [Volvox reticuliferus]|uniref:Uncharacterized protein n=1 Tax=Volvox reticuliferus TaxID=1737510 RepID=A0A8J4GDL5_9CHLO|nr:hypothetical protein Vretimale_9896 [Volvox reticuliferus]